MRKLLLLAAVLTVASPAFAGEAQKATTKAPAIKATQLSEAEMDRIVAGDEVSFTNNGVNFVIETGRNPFGVVVNNGGTFLLGSASK
jgi:hypothetical protein